MLLYIIRHADPDYKTDSLTDRGIFQAKALSKRLLKSGIDRIFTSPLGRARETAQFTCDLLKKEINVEKWTKEVNVSQLEAEAIKVNENGVKFLEGLGYQREDDGYRILRKNDERVALFCHGAFIIVWLADLLNVSLDIMLKSFTVTHTGVTVIEFPDDENGISQPRCLCFSDISHLYAEKLDLLHDNRIEL